MVRNTKEVSNKEPLISIIIPVYKVEKYLKRCVDSVIKQTYKNLEIILIDDGSPDNCPKICDDYSKKDKRIEVIHKKNGGVSAARNKGLKLSNGDYIVFVDSDDWLEYNFVEEMLTNLRKNKVDYIVCGYNRVYDDKKEIINGNMNKELIPSSNYLIKLLNVQNGYGFVHMKMINKKALQNVIFNEKLIVGEDALFNIEVCKNIENVLIYNRPLYNYFFNSNSVVRKYDDNYCNNYLESMKLMKNYIMNNYKDKEIINNLYNYIAYHILLICVNYCFHPDNHKKGKQLLKETCNMDLFKEAIKNSNYNDLSITRKISLFSLKHKLYTIMAIICIIRQKQFKR